MYNTVGGTTKKPRAPRWNEIVATLTEAIHADGNDMSGGVVRKLSENSHYENAPNAKLTRIRSKTTSDVVSSAEHGNLQVMGCYLGE